MYVCMYVCVCVHCMQGMKSAIPQSCSEHSSKQRSPDDAGVVNLTRRIMHTSGTVQFAARPCCSLHALRAGRRGPVVPKP